MDTDRRRDGKEKSEKGSQEKVNCEALTDGGKGRIEEEKEGKRMR